MPKTWSRNKGQLHEPKQIIMRDNGEIVLLILAQPHILERLFKIFFHVTCQNPISFIHNSLTAL